MNLSKKELANLQVLYIALCEGAEKKIKMDKEKMVSMITLLLENNPKVFRYLPEELEESMFSFQKEVGTPTEEMKTMAIALVKYYLNVVIYEALINEKMDNKTKDRLYCNAVQSQYCINNMILGKVDTIPKFKEEFKQITTLMGSYYSLKVEDQTRRDILSVQIKEKIKEFYNRFDFNYGLFPSCC